MHASSPRLSLCPHHLAIDTPPCPFHIPTHLASNLATPNAWIASTTAARRLEDGKLGPSTACAAPRRRRILLCIEAFRTPLYVHYDSFALKHRLAHSVHVYNPSCLAQSRHHGKITALLSPFPARVRLKSLVTLATNLRRYPLSQRRLSGSCGALSYHTHTHTHTHSLSLSLSSHRRSNDYQPPIHLLHSILSHPSFELTCGPSVCDTGEPSEKMLLATLKSAAPRSRRKISQGRHRGGVAVGRIFLLSGRRESENRINCR